jgi:hypothetical protein
MRALGLVLVLIALAGAAGCGAAKAKPSETTDGVVTLLRATWGETVGFPSFDYSCQRLDEQGRLFSCLARDRTRTVKLASFDVICDGSDCTWTYYPAYIG